MNLPYKSVEGLRACCKRAFVPAGEGSGEDRLTAGLLLSVPPAGKTMGKEHRFLLIIRNSIAINKE